MLLLALWLAAPHCGRWIDQHSLQTRRLTWPHLRRIITRRQMQMMMRVLLTALVMLALCLNQSAIHCRSCRRHRSMAVHLIGMCHLQLRLSHLCIGGLTSSNLMLCTILTSMIYKMHTCKVNHFVLQQMQQTFHQWTIHVLLMQLLARTVTICLAWLMTVILRPAPTATLMTMTPKLLMKAWGRSCKEALCLHQHLAMQIMKLHQSSRFLSWAWAVSTKRNLHSLYCTTVIQTRWKSTHCIELASKHTERYSKCSQLTVHMTNNGGLRQ